MMSSLDDLWLGKHHGGGGFGRFAVRFPFGFGHGGSGFRTGRKFAAADLKLIILALLAEKPRHGYELIKALEELSRGFYSPSPGMIYPALTYLDEIGYATAQVEANRKLFSITDAGRRHLEENRDTVDIMLDELTRVGAKMDRLRRVFTGDDQSGFENDRVDRDETSAMRSARQVLNKALHAKHHCSTEEARRIAGVLRRAAAEILEKS